MRYLIGTYRFFIYRVPTQYRRLGRVGARDEQLLRVTPYITYFRPLYSLYRGSLYMFIMVDYYFPSAKQDSYFINITRILD